MRNYIKYALTKLEGDILKEKIDKIAPEGQKKFNYDRNKGKRDNFFKRDNDRNDRNEKNNRNNRNDRNNRGSSSFRGNRNNNSGYKGNQGNHQKINYNRK